MKYVLVAGGVALLGFIMLGVVNPFLAARHQAATILAGVVDAGTISGRVTAKDGTPVADAMVIIEGLESGGASDANGSYSISGIEPGKHLLVAGCTGYLPVTVEVTLKGEKGLYVNFVLTEEDSR